MKVLIVSDAWNQTNGVVTTLETTIKHLEKNGFVVEIIHPGLFKGISFPFYKEIKLVSLLEKQKFQWMIETINPDYIHIPVEGPLGIFARNYCLHNNLNFTTAYHTHFPAYIEKMFFIPETITYQYIKWFHRPSSNVMVSTNFLIEELPKHGINNVVKWSRGVDIELFNPNKRDKYVEQKYALYVGRVSIEKNIQQFLQTNTGDLKKVVVGDGPSRKLLEKTYPDVYFVGKKKGEELAKFFANAEVFVFPSRTDTFGLVMLEALSCGTPVAAVDVAHNYEIINDDVGCISNNLEFAIHQARKKNRETCRQHVLENFTWEKATEQFINNLVPIF